MLTETKPPTPPAPCSDPLRSKPQRYDRIKLLVVSISATRFHSSYTNRLVDCGVNADPFQLETSLLPRLTPIKSLAKQQRLRLPSSFQGCFQSTTATKTRDSK